MFLARLLKSFALTFGSVLGFFREYRNPSGNAEMQSATVTKVGRMPQVVLLIRTSSQATQVSVGRAGQMYASSHGQGFGFIIYKILHVKQIHHSYDADSKRPS